MQLPVLEAGRSDMLHDIYHITKLSSTGNPVCPTSSEGHTAAEDGRMLPISSPSFRVSGATETFLHIQELGRWHSNDIKNTFGKGSVSGLGSSSC